jgi:hypothetical protein
MTLVLRKQRGQDRIEGRGTTTRSEPSTITPMKPRSGASTGSKFRMTSNGCGFCRSCRPRRQTKALPTRWRKRKRRWPRAMRAGNDGGGTRSVRSDRTRTRTRNVSAYRWRSLAARRRRPPTPLQPGSRNPVAPNDALAPAIAAAPPASAPAANSSPQGAAACYPDARTSKGYGDIIRYFGMCWI